MGMICAAILTACFVGNVAWGSFNNGVAPLGNVAEMILLFCASIAFVIDVLGREARVKAAEQDEQ